MEEKLFDQISADIKAAMLARDKVTLEALRGIKKEFLEAKTAKGGDGTLHDDQGVKIMQKMVKQRKETALIYREQNRSELAENELAEAAVIEKYLPQQMSDAELEKIQEALSLGEYTPKLFDSRVNSNLKSLISADLILLIILIRSDLK